MVEIEDIDLINHTQKIDVNFLPNIGKKLNGFFHTILTHPVWGSCLVFRRIEVDGGLWLMGGLGGLGLLRLLGGLGNGRTGVDGWTEVVGRTGEWGWFFTRLKDT